MSFALFLVVYLFALLFSPLWAPLFYLWGVLRGRPPRGKGIAFLGVITFFMTGGWLVGALIAEARGMTAVALALAAPAVALALYSVLQTPVERLYRWVLAARRGGRTL